MAVAAILSVAETFTALYDAISNAADKLRGRDKETVKELKGELDEFLNNIFGWYNKIIRFAIPVLDDFALGQAVDSEKVHEYRTLLHKIQRDDEYWSKCRGFVEAGLPDYGREVRNPKIRASLQNLGRAYEAFERAALNSKDTLGVLLSGYSELNKGTMKDAELVRAALTRLESTKDALRTSSLEIKFAKS